MKKNMKKEKGLLEAGVTTFGRGLLVGMIVCIVAFVVLLASYESVVEYEVKQRDWVRQELGDADPGSGNTGFMYVMVYPHHATDPIETTYGVNLSNDSAAGGAYEFSDSLGSVELTNETPHSVACDFVMKVRVNNSDGYNTSGAQWENDWVRASVTIDFDYLSDLSDVAMDEVVIGTHGTTYRWYHYVVNNSGSGYTLSKGERFNITSITFDVYE